MHGSGMCARRNFIYFWEGKGTMFPKNGKNGEHFCSFLLKEEVGKIPLGLL